MAVSPFQEIEICECGEPLVDVASYGIACDPRYYNQGLSPHSSIFVRKRVAEKLLKVQEALDGVRLLAWDGHRTRELQNAIYQKFWNEIEVQHPNWSQEQLFVEVGKFVTPATDPNRVPPHATGGAIDLTLLDLNRTPLDMGTDFDDFTSKASLHSSEVNPEARRNRMLLVNAMEKEGFVVYPDEWWHFGYGDQLSVYLKGGTTAIYGEVKHK